MKSTREYWIERLEASLPPRDDVIGRNAVITASYARWYLRHPSLCKWAGMAVFASSEAGVYLRALMGQGAARYLPASIRGATAGLIRSTNNGVFDDIAWTHAAYLAPDGGIESVGEGLDAPSHALLREGFLDIERGRRMVERDPHAAARLVWAGNRALLEHEQRHTVQPFFGRFPASFARFLSLAAAADFCLGDARIEQPSRPRFMRYMLGEGRAVLRATGCRLPNIARFDHRWHWIDRDVLPCWVAVEEARWPALRERMEQLACIDAFGATAVAGLGAEGV
jgi:hypothetical protein